MRHPLLALSLLAASSAASAEINLDFVPAPTQSNFELVSKDLTAGLNYKALGPAEATGITGIGVGGFIAYVPVENEIAWRGLTGQNVDEIGMAGVVVHKGLPFDIDLGAFYASLPGTDAEVLGGEVRYAFIPGSTVLPALALRVAYTTLQGVDDLDFSTTSVDMSLSKGFTLLTPYLGIGYVEGKADPSPVFVTLRKETTEAVRAFVGLRLALGLFEITPEFEQVGDNSSYNLRLGLSF